MGFVRRRTTKTGTVSTALVEDTLQALGRLAAERDSLRKERAKLEPELPHAEKFYQVVMVNMGTGRRYSDDELKEIDRLMKARKRLLKRVAEIDARLSVIAKEGAIIKKHCTATTEEIRAAANAHAEELRNKEAYALGVELALAQAKGKEDAFLKKFFQQ